jgi:hypothetical protein
MSPSSLAMSTRQLKYLLIGVPPKMDLICGRPDPSAIGEIVAIMKTDAIVKRTVHVTHSRNPVKPF